MGYRVCGCGNGNEGEELAQHSHHTRMQVCENPPRRPFDNGLFSRPLPWGEINSLKLLDETNNVDQLMREDIEKQGPEIERRGELPRDFKQPMVLQADAVQLVLLHDVRTDAPHEVVAYQMRERSIRHFLRPQVSKRLHLVANAFTLSPGERIKSPHHVLGLTPRALDDSSMPGFEHPPHLKAYYIMLPRSPRDRMGCPLPTPTRKDVSALPSLALMTDPPRKRFPNRKRTRETNVCGHDESH